MSEKVKGYYGLPKEKKWLEDNDSPFSIGGRNTDVSQIGYSLYHKIRSINKINQVPWEVVNRLDVLVKLLQDGEKEIEDFIDWYSDLINKDVEGVK